MARILILVDLVVVAASALAFEGGSEVPAASSSAVGARPTAPQTAGGLRAGRTQDAVGILADAVRAARQRGGTSPELAGALNDLGSMYQDTDRLPEAARCYSEAIEILKRGGASKSSLLVALRNLAGLRVTETRYSEAEKLYRDALEVAVSEFGTNSTETASICNGLADAFVATGRYTEARQFSERALALLETSGGDPNKAVSLFILSKLAWQRGAKDEAESWLRRAVNAWRESVGVGHPSYAAGLASLATVLSSSRPDEADRLFRQALDILGATLGETHSYFGWVMSLYSRHLELHGRKKEAKELKRRADAIVTGQSLRNGLGHTVDVESLRPAPHATSR